MTWEVAGITHTAMLGGWELRVIGSSQHGCRWDVAWVEGGTVVVASGATDPGVAVEAVRQTAQEALRAWVAREVEQATRRVTGWRRWSGGKAALLWERWRLEARVGGHWVVYLDGEDDYAALAHGNCPDPKAQRAALLKAWRTWLREQAVLLDL